MLGLLAGLGMGVANAFGGAAKAKKQREVEASKEQFSPWTGMHGDSNKIQGATPIGDVAGGALTGLGLEQNLSQAGGLNDWLKNNSAWKDLAGSEFGKNPLISSGSQLGKDPFKMIG